jgi:hypothetical protein
MAASVLYAWGMKEIDRVDRAKERADESAYKKGLREGFDQAAWFFTLLFICLVWFFN